MKKIVLYISLIILLIIGVFTLTGCSSDDENIPDVDNRFKKIYSGWNYYVIYDTETKVMYSVSDGAENKGTLTLLVDTDGKPLLYDDN